MFEYLTVEEVAEKWGVTAQQVQGLCRGGKIPGAVKKGIMWFIPRDAEHPRRAGDRPFRFQKTKRRIFESAVTLFSRLSYETVTLKDVAEAVGIAQSAIYRHFSSKQELLDTIYEYFSHYFIADRPTIGELLSQIEHGSLSDLINGCTYAFREEHRELMISCMRIIFQRMSIDERASRIFRELMLESGLSFAQQYFEKAIELGRLPQTDAYMLSVMCNMTMNFMLLNSLAQCGQAHMKRIEASQQRLQEMVLRSLMDLRE